MVELPLKIPSEVYLNQSLEFKLRFSDYDPATWIATLFIQMSTGKYSLVATNDGGLFAFQGTDFDAETGTFSPGDAEYFIQVVSGTRKLIIARGALRILADPSGDAADFRSHVKKTLDAIRSVIEGTATRDDQNYTISTENGSRSLSRFSPAELLVLEKDYAARYREEQKRNRRKSGKKPGTSVKARFGRG